MPTVGAEQFLRPCLEGLTLRLFVAIVDLKPTMAVEEFKEPTFLGYGPQPVKDWEFADGLFSGSVCEFDAGTTMISGYFLTRADGTWAWAHQFPTPATGKIIITPKVMAK